jgi:hypothetical protein
MFSMHPTLETLSQRPTVSGCGTCFYRFPGPFAPELDKLVLSGILSLP